MRVEKSCGAVVFTRDNNEIKYLITKQLNGVVGFPKGHVEENETEEETALREVFEETGLYVSLIKGFRTEDSHPIPGTDIQKSIVYFLAEYDGQTPIPQETEIGKIYIVPFDDAMRLFNYESSKRILKEADDFLKSFLKNIMKEQKYVSNM